MTQPNILFVLVDQMRPDEWNGTLTPNLARIAKGGISFPNAYSAAPLCQPARNCIITGKYPTVTGVCGNMNTPVGDSDRRDTYARHLQSAGYHTAYIGKHHYIDRYNVGMDLIDDDDDFRAYGYDHVWHVSDVIEGAHNDDRYTHWLAEQGKLNAHRANLKRDHYESFAPEETVDGYICTKALEWVSAYEGNQPFMLTVGIVGPHPPYWAPGKYKTMFSPEDVPAPKGVSDPTEIQRAKYARARKWGMIRMIDDYVGELWAKLEEKGMLEDTMFVFTADHGDTIGDYGTNDKRFFYDCSAGVPLILAGASVPIDPREPPLECKTLVSGVDLYPTFLDAAGCEHLLGSDPGRRCGKSLLRLIDDRERPRPAVFSELGTSIMVRTPQWKLVFDPEEGGVRMLFNRYRDPDELDNLAGTPGHQDVEKRLVELCLEHTIRQTRFTHTKERKRVQQVRV
ncbi:MAG: sulfatase-like hydrolase/transferase [Lentisphaerae bacterium]|jgi:arylsulfatase|nr:sulfatase-like hydrolase/transferase [Lentisphaerota bacterium]MBT4817323.1 sulfatase-like hydrolase/transferase [Lentisphaerota bacterium]MBT5613086.1 sulfatase-like hydrolase/transferase [Lentisphaerota bacterium]MBT7056442.1 sulfatase-like hydrolase/transferase [Lentisphaerota bacterium]MBT7844471.1 sulfatase-like hydrolase/transferase [Lentisphaerota bacterium]